MTIWYLYLTYLLILQSCEGGEKKRKDKNAPACEFWDRFARSHRVYFESGIFVFQNVSTIPLVRGDAKIKEKEPRNQKSD